MSRFAIAALVCGLISIVFGLLGWIVTAGLAAKAISDTHRHPWVKGEALAIAALALIPIGLVVRIVVLTLA